MRLTKKDMTATASAAAATKPAASACIRVVDYGSAKVAEDAGNDHGSSWCPPQCARRTGLGGFFSS